MNFFSVLKYIEESRNDAALAAQFAEIENSCFARGEKEIVVAKSLEVAGYRFLSLHLVGHLKVSTFKGCKVVFQGPGVDMEIESDTVEIKTDYSRKLGLGITAFDIDQDAELEQNIREQKIRSFSVIFEKQTNTYTIDKPELLIAALDQPVGDDDQEIDYTEVEQEENQEEGHSEEKPFGEKPSTDPLMP